VSRLPIAVVGCGHLGRIHAQLLSELDTVELVGVVDPRGAARQAVAELVGVPAFDDYRPLLGRIRAAVLAVPTTQHAQLAMELIGQGIHLLVEKPLTDTAASAMALADAARQRGLVLAVGHVERFNPAFTALQAELTTEPVFLEATRTSGFAFRSMDIGVVLDLMIHDLELVLAIVNRPVAWVSAVGIPVVSGQEDWAIAHLVFQNGCVAQLKASRISPVNERSLTVYSRDQHFFVDLSQRRIQRLERCAELRNGQMQVEQLSATESELYKHRMFQTLVPVTDLPVINTNPLQDELRDFVASIDRYQAPRVSADHAALAIQWAERIIEQIHADRSARQAHEATTRRLAA
jgi:predicted dehydrogenase